MGYRRASCISFVLSIIFLCLGDGLNSKAFAESGKLVYVTDGLDLPFWRYVAVGVSDVAKTSGFGYAALDSHHDAQTQMQNTQDALAKDTAGIVLSPTDSTSVSARITSRHSALVSSTLALSTEQTFPLRVRASSKAARATRRT